MINGLCCSLTVFACLFVDMVIVVVVAAAGSMRSVMDRRLDIDGVVIDSPSDERMGKTHTGK
jgi:hypothetical protein